MPGLYRAKVEGKVILGRAGLALPFTPSDGPICFAQDHKNFFVSPMVNDFKNPKAPWVGNPGQLPGGGIKTFHMDNCVTVCVAELQMNAGNGNCWSRAFFAHLSGGNWDWCDSGEKFKDFSLTVNPNLCYSLVIANFRTGTGTTIEKILNSGFPVEKMSVYITNMGTTDVAVEFRNKGEFGLIHWSGGRSDEEPNGFDPRGIKTYFNLS
ncbi:hypothetical protein [Pelagibius sp. Alg239-R121]|uniref:hypothetical protein n=1 Tax=Pelagibius sp. Alg239-R121 TaxID=2993448 RepID=UPI0024A782F0|nr:hypothetical protein [Pelagibius sp. Alg239-R121]